MALWIVEKDFEFENDKVLSKNTHFPAIWIFCKKNSIIKNICMRKNPIYNLNVLGPLNYNYIKINILNRIEFTIMNIRAILPKSPFRMTI